MPFRERTEFLFAPARTDAPGHLWARWIWLRALGLIFFSAFYSFAYQVRGLIGTRGILPAGEYLTFLRSALPGVKHFWVAPSLFWLHPADGMLNALVAVGLVASAALAIGLWPRLAIAVCVVCFLSLIGVLQDFASYQSDGMLMEAGVLSWFFAPHGIAPGIGATDPPSRASLWMLRWEWFRIYFCSGVVKLGSGDPQWRHLTAMDHYYENGPLPTWVGWYAQQLPHGFHATVTVFTLLTELVLVWMLFFPRRWKMLCAAIVTPLQVAIIATANYAFLNYLVLSLGVLLLDDRALAPVASAMTRSWVRVTRRLQPGEEDAADIVEARTGTPIMTDAIRAVTTRQPGLMSLYTRAAVLTLLLLSTISTFPVIGDGLPLRPIARVMQPLRLGEAYGLFAVMTTERDEIEFQGSRDGKTWVPYPFRYKPQDMSDAPAIYAPYQPRFDWNLWFASLGDWRASPWLLSVQVRLLENDPDVLRLFRANPFEDAPPAQVRTVLWRYWFTDIPTKRDTGRWWNREMLGEFTGRVLRGADGQLMRVEPEVIVTPGLR